MVLIRAGKRFTAETLRLTQPSRGHAGPYREPGSSAASPNQNRPRPRGQSSWQARFVTVRKDKVGVRFELVGQGQRRQRSPAEGSLDASSLRSRRRTRRRRPPHHHPRPGIGRCRAVPYDYMTAEGFEASGFLNSPPNGQCLNLPGAGEDNPQPARSPKNRTDAWATVFTGTGCGGDSFSLRPHTGLPRSGSRSAPSSSTDAATPGCGSPQRCSTALSPTAKAWAEPGAGGKAAIGTRVRAVLGRPGPVPHTHTARSAADLYSAAPGVVLGEVYRSRVDRGGRCRCVLRLPGDPPPLARVRAEAGPPAHTPPGRLRGA